MQDGRYWCGESERLRRSGDLSGAVAAARTALSVSGPDAAAYAHLAHALRLSGDADAAAQAASEAIRCDAAHAPGWFNLGALLVTRGRVSEGVAAYRQAITLDPRYAEAWSNLGGALGATGDTDGELEAYSKAVDANPELPPLWSNLGDALRARHDFVAAEAALRKAIALDANYAPAWTNLALMLRDAGRYEEAAEAGRRAVALDRFCAEAWSNLGNALVELGRHEEALSAHREAEVQKPDDPAVLFNLGVALKAAGETRAAATVYRRALSRPDVQMLGPKRVADLHWNLSLALLALGELEEGWREYASRWTRSQADTPRHALRDADIKPEPGSRVLVWGEQGIGDEILYASMIPDLIAADMRVTFECDPRLTGLFERSLGNVTISPRGMTGSAATHDLAIPAASLGRWYRSAWTAFPKRAGYLHADGFRSDGYHALLTGALSATGSARTPVVGMSWRSRNEDSGNHKSHDPRLWNKLLRSDVTWVNLQYGDTRGDVAIFRDVSGVTPVDVPGLDRYNDIDGLAALIAACDLVITVSNVTAHIAGALGRPVWLLLPKARGKIWYWFEDRVDSPWYPSMRIFRQTRTGDWDSVMARVGAAFAEWRRDIGR